MEFTEEVVEAYVMENEAKFPRIMVNFCLVLLQVPKCFVPNFLSQPKNLTAFSASSKTFVPAQKPILQNANHLFVWHKMFVTGTIRK